MTKKFIRSMPESADPARFDRPRRLEPPHLPQYRGGSLTVDTAAAAGDARAANPAWRRRRRGETAAFPRVRGLG
jgi:hypothetical protein